MPDKSRKSSQAKYQRRKAARQKLIQRTTAAPQTAQSEDTAQVTATTASAVQTPDVEVFSVGNELRKISYLGGALIVILIIVTIILRYTMND